MGTRQRCTDSLAVDGFPELGGELIGRASIELLTTLSAFVTALSNPFANVGSPAAISPVSFGPR